MLLFVRPYNEATMIKKLSAVGNSLGLIIERPILELLDITKDTSLEVKTDGVALIIRPVKLSNKERLRESTKRMMATHEETLRKLAK
jgi:antitoxin MazE